MSMTSPTNTTAQEKKHNTTQQGPKIKRPKCNYNPKKDGNRSELYG